MHLYNTLNQTDKGRRWVAINTTIGTPITIQNTNAFSDTAATVALYNNSGVGLATGVVPPGRNVVPDYIKLLVATGGTGGAKLAITLDNVQRGVTANSGVSVGNADSDSLGSSSIAKVQFGALAPSAAGANRIFVANDYLKNAVLAAGDEILVTFAEPTTGLGAQTTKLHVPVGLTTIGPGGLMLLHIYGATSAGTMELEMGWWELS